jgi:hypothetical protein
MESLEVSRIKVTSILFFEVSLYIICMYEGHFIASERVPSVRSKLCLSRG